jgi:hypothetical protein
MVTHVAPKNIVENLFSTMYDIEKKKYMSHIFSSTEVLPLSSNQCYTCQTINARCQKNKTLFKHAIQKRPMGKRKENVPQQQRNLPLRHAQYGIVVGDRRVLRWMLKDDRSVSLTDVSDFLNGLFHRGVGNYKHHAVQDLPVF